LSRDGLPFPIVAGAAIVVSLLVDFSESGKGMGLMGARRIRREQRRVDMAESRHVNGIRKSKERVRRDTRVLGLLKQAKPPYTPVVMSWLSARLDKPAARITQADVDALLAKPS
jgi:hypothetical protein